MNACGGVLEPVDLRDVRMIEGCEDLRFAATSDPGWFVSSRLGLITCPDGMWGCFWRRGRVVPVNVYIDDRPAFGGMDELRGYSLDDFQLIEVVRSCAMVRAYTTHFMERAARSPRVLANTLAFDCWAVSRRPLSGTL